MTHQEYRERLDKEITEYATTLLEARRNFDPLLEAKNRQLFQQAIDRLFLDVTGEDEDRSHRYNKNWQAEIDGRNYLRKELRTTITGKEGGE